MYLQLGGIGFVHYNMPLEQQVEAVKRVKQQAAGFEANPIVLSPKQELKEIKEIQVCGCDLACRILCMSAHAANLSNTWLLVLKDLTCMKAVSGEVNCMTKGMHCTGQLYQHHFSL